MDKGKDKEQINCLGTKNNSWWEICYGSQSCTPKSHYLEKMKSSLLSQEQKAGKSDEHVEEGKASGTEKAKYIRWN